jgi:ABC-type glycerol-3-phosphate transport system substrate-binding protein
VPKQSTGLTRRRLTVHAVKWTAGAGMLALAGCSAPGEQAAGTGGTKVEPTVQLTYLHQWSQTQGHGPITDTLVTRFKEQHPSIQIESVFTADYYAKLAAILAGGDFPDIVTYNLAWLPLLVKKGVIVPSETLAKGNYRITLNDLMPAAKEMASFDGKLTVMPYVLNSSGLALNVSLYRQKGLNPSAPPATWNDLVEQARRLTGRDGEKEVWGTVFPRGTADSISPLTAFIWQNGGDLVDVKTRTASWTSAPAIEALQFQVDLVHRHRVASYPQPANGEQGTAAIWHVPPGNVAALQIRVKDAFEWTIAELPKGKQAATTVGGHSLAALKTNKHHEQAWRFIHWYTTPAVNAEYLVASTTLPPWKASEQHSIWQKYTQEEPRIKPFVRMLSYARPSPKLSRWEEIVSILAAARDEAAAQKKTPKEALDDAARQATPLIQEG